MKIVESCNSRTLNLINKDYDLVVVGGGMSGVCCAIAAARQGVKTALVQARPVLGGNASSEVRLWVLGATSHMGNNNRWSREGWILDEILVENTYRNKEGNPVLFDMVLLDKVLAEKNIDLYLNTIVTGISKDGNRYVSEVLAFNPQNSTEYLLRGKFFADCSGDGIVAYLAGASFRMGAEDKEEYNELFAPDKKQYGELLGHSIFFYMKDTGQPIRYKAPDFALKNPERYITKLQVDEYTNPKHHGCKYWWIEYGGRLDTVYDTEKIKYELWKVVYGVWDYLKNSGNYPELENYTLEWVGLVPGKRESRRFIGHYMLSQQDIIQQESHYDDVAYGGWSIDLHPADGVYAPGKACNQWHSKGVYPIPLRCYISADIDNLFICGRIMSATHVAQGSTRVMCTASYGGQAVGVTVATCLKESCLPIECCKGNRINSIQKILLENGQYIPMLNINDSESIISKAEITVSSELMVSELPLGNTFCSLTDPVAMLFPLYGKVPQIGFWVNNKNTRTELLLVQLRKSIKVQNFTPDTIVTEKVYECQPGLHNMQIDFGIEVEEQYYFLCFMKNDFLEIAESEMLLTGIMPVYNYQNPAVSNYGKQCAPEGIGIDSFEFWCPKRRPQGKNLALSFSPALKAFDKEYLRNMTQRPVIRTNAWVADLSDASPCIELSWLKPMQIHSIRLFFDTNADLALENVQIGHYDAIVPTCVRKYQITDKQGNIIYSKYDNYQTINDINFSIPIEVDTVKIYLEHPFSNIPAALFGIIIF